MTYLRMLWPLAVAASLAACSGNLGGGQSTLPGTLPPGGGTNVQSVTPPTPTASPQSASNVATVGDSTAPQTLPEVMGWGGTIAFPKPIPAPSPSPNAKSTPAASTAVPGTPVSIGITAAVVEPSDAPHFRSNGKHADAAAPKGLFFISLLSTADVTLGEYPKIAVDVPRDVAAKYHDQAFGLALYDPENSVKAYRLAVAERDATASGTASVPAATATPLPTPAPTPGEAANGAAALTPPPVGTGLGANALPPDHVAFLGTAASLTLKSNRPVVFAVYAAPIPPSPSPSPSGSAASPAAPAPRPSISPASGVHASTTSTLPTAAPQASPAPLPSPS